jgi:hypothetical protein
MSLTKKVKVGLDELRILVLGSQILLGFQFQAVFRPAFEKLPFTQRWVEVGALSFVTITLGLLIAPSMQHRIVEKGQDTPRILEAISCFAALALLSLALVLGADTYLAAARALDETAARSLGLVATLVALMFWFGFEYLRLQSMNDKECPMSPSQLTVEQTPLEAKIEQMLTEARVMLPGAQAILGFQLVITFSDAFEQMPGSWKLAHIAALLFVTLTVIWLMAPAAFHRIVYGGEDSAEFHRLGTVFLIAASVTLALGIAVDLGVVVAKALSSRAAGEVAGIVALAFLFTLWHAIPAALRYRHKHIGSRNRRNPIPRPNSPLGTPPPN